MNDIHDIFTPEKPNLLGFWVFSVIIFSLIAIFFWFRIKGGKNKEGNVLSTKKTRFQISKRDSLEKLKMLRLELERGEVEIDLFYEKLSEIVREFIESFEKNNALKKTKKELKYLEKAELNKILEKSYRAEFAQNFGKKSEAEEIIRNAMEVVKKWS